MKEKSCSRGHSVYRVRAGGIIGCALVGMTSLWVTARASAQAVTLTDAAVAQSTTLGTIGDGKLDYVYNPTTGDVTLNLDGVQNVVDLHLLSAGGKFIPANSTFTSFPTKSPGELESTLFGSTFAQGFDLGNVLPANLTATTLLQDLTLLYSVNGGGTEQAATLVMAPEPTTLGLIVMSIGGLAARRRRRSQDLAT